MKSYAIIPIVLALCVLAGCSNRPSIDDGRKAIQAKIDQESEGRCVLVEFQKTNGQEGALNGVKAYNMEYSLTIEFPKKCKWLFNPLLGLSFRTSLPPKSTGALMDIVDAVDPMKKGELVEDGERRQLSGSILFEKTENGWRPAGTMQAPTKIIKVDSPNEDKDLANAKAGNSAAQESMAFKCSQAGRKEEAVLWYRMAAEQGEPFAQWQLVTTFFNGDGVARNPEEGVKWARKLIEGPKFQLEGMYYLGVAYVKGEGVLKNEEEGLRWLRKAADAGHDLSKRELRQLESGKR